MNTMHNPAHPGEVLREWLIDLSVTDAARKLGITRAALSRLLHGHTGISPQMALRLSIALGTSAESWLQMQMHYDLWRVKQHPIPHIERLLPIA